MENAGTGSHPLHIPGPDHATLTGGIPVRHFALVDNRDGFKAAMGMLTHTARLGRWGKAGRAGIVQ